MILKLLKDRYSTEQAKEIQLSYLSKIQKEAPSKLTLPDLNKINHIVGVDISYYYEENQEFGIACATLMNFKDLNLIETHFAKGKINFPYVAGFLGFRECKLLAKALLKIQQKYQIVMCDGHGKIHPRRFGEAVQLGLALDIPTIGVAKSPYVGYSDWKNLKRKKGNKTPVWSNEPEHKLKQGKELLGYAICLRDGSRPVFVSEGYKVDIELALEIVIKISVKNHRLPEPLYLADRFSKEKIKT
jgi:deoxyribonuclease V